MFDICCIGHITADKVVTPQTVKYMPGGTAYYFSCAVAQFDLSYLLVTSLADAEMHYVNDLQHQGIEVRVQPSEHTVNFENIYSGNSDDRTQNVLQKADAFNIDQLLDIEAKIFHLGPLLADDISVEIIKALSQKSLVSLDVQGYLRKVVDNKVYSTNWGADKREALQYVHTIKADESELLALTGYNNVLKGAQLLADWGVKEVVVTNGSKGSIIYYDNTFHTIPAYRPIEAIDATGCGDTYMAGYLFRRIKGFDIQQSGEFAAAIATLKMEASGPFMGKEGDVMQFLINY